jgi:glycosyltransferase involved in cell wall biosynthesis
MLPELDIAPRDPEDVSPPEFYSDQGPRREIAPMKITFLMPGYVWGPSGGARVIYEYANQLVSRGHQVTLVHPRRCENSPNAPFQFGVMGILRGARNTQFKLREMFTKPPISWQRLDARVHLEYVPSPDSRHIPDADAVFATAWYTAAPVLDLPPAKGHKFYLIQGYETWMGSKPLVDETWRFPLHKIVVSQWLRRLGSDLGCGDIACVPNAIDHARYKITRAVAGRRKQVAMMFSSVPLKGAIDGIRALEIARHRHPDLQAVFFGAGRRQSWLPRWVRYYRNPSQDFIVNEIYNGSQVFVSPSWEEGFSLPVAEAVACGCAIASTASGGVRDYIQDGVSGLLSQPKDPAALADNLRLLLENDGLRLKLADAARASVNRLTWDSSAALLEVFVADNMNGISRSS